MGSDRIRLAERTTDDWAALSSDEKDLCADAFRALDADPIAGVPLFDPLRGFWSYRSKWLRIVYRIEAQARFVVILSITRAAEASS